MKPFASSTAAYAPELAIAPIGEAAPARNRVRMLALAMFALLLLLAGRAVQLAFSGDPLAEPRRSAGVVAVPRADIVDRNGVLLATTVRAFALTAEPRRVWDAEQTADALRRLFPEMDRATTIRRLNDRSRQLVYLRRSLTPDQREQVLALGLGGIGFEAEDRRVYPQGALAAHALGFTDVDLSPLAGVERGLDVQIREAGAAGRAVTLSLDVRMQYAVEDELAQAARAAGASGGAAILLDGRTGEVFALASWPRYDANDPGAASENARRDRVAGDLHELGSTMKPFTVAMALEEELTTSGELFNIGARYELDGSVIEDHEPRAPALATLRDIITHSSNIGAAQLALRIGGARQRAYLERLGLTSPPSLELARNQAPIAPRASARRDVAGLGFGYGLAATQASLAGAYTIFANQGARVQPTLLRRSAEGVERTPVFSPEVTRQLVAYMRATVTSGTGRAADVPGLVVAGKTGTAEVFTGPGGYDESRNFSSFAGIFPANDPRYVIVLSLDETGEGAAGGMVAAPAVGRILRRIAPMLGLRVEPGAPAR